jgi:hypothetical protein
MDSAFGFFALEWTSVSVGRGCAIGMERSGNAEGAEPRMELLGHSQAVAENGLEQLPCPRPAHRHRPENELVEA